MRESRISERRQGFNSGQTFPFTDCAGDTIREDRRRMSDRRLNNIRLEVLDGTFRFTVLPGGKID